MLEDLVEDYRKHSENTWYQSVMNIIARANEERFKEDNSMVCDALMEIMGDKLEEKIEERVEKEAEKINLLCAELIRLGRQEDLVGATTDEKYRNELLEEFDIK